MINARESGAGGMLREVWSGEASLVGLRMGEVLGQTERQLEMVLQAREQRS